MAKLQNIAKAAKAKTEKAKYARQDATCLTETIDGEEHVIALYKDKSKEAIRLTIESVAQCKVVEKELEKDSKVRQNYASEIKDGERFLDDVSTIL